MTKKDYGAANKVSRRKRIGIIKPPENPLSSHFTAKIPLTYKSGFPILTSNESKFLSNIKKTCGTNFTGGRLELAGLSKWGKDYDTSRIDCYDTQCFCNGWSTVAVDRSVCRNRTR